MRVLFDTGAIIALTYSHDPMHQRARRFAQTRGLRLATTGAAIGEAYTFIRGKSGYAIARDTVFPLRAGGVVSIEAMDAAFDIETWRVIEEFSGVPLSYVDASLVALGRRMRIRKVFAFDEDFALAGLELVPGDDG